ncbi:hypothetical protein DOK76_01540 [Vagococcus sp. DIV0080]|uniref:Uncharacterized protein n=1 Tax=Candidatus Vagococcus giribetii TaxID=2230876 RepID=A0ABS3HPR1_9ENTE|nr:hypothetical protein [Vagococcus sp. DIV0080]MBO0475732.1 hypothetical protein [Vagococcus sp. DIV0080]
MLKIIEVIEDANRKDCSLPALALALTLPDICSQIEYPHETNVGYRYRQWYKNHVHTHEEYHELQNTYYARVHSEENMLAHFNGHACYKLRCLLLHQGDSALQGEVLYEDLYFHIDSTQDPNDYLGFKDGHISVNSKLLSEYLCKYAKEYYNSHPNKDLFQKQVSHA